MMFSNYEEAIHFLYNALPAYQRVGDKALKIDLSNIRSLTSALGNPQTAFKAIHIAGTNGKGSVSHMMAAALISAGYKTGLYTSPHYVDFRERIRVDGKMIDKDTVVSFVNAHQKLFEDIRPSFFEMTVALAFSEFARQEVDVAIIETGLGGRLDSTNIVVPILSVITNIALDHTEYLGNTLEAIAAEKAGIIKSGVPCVVGRASDQVKKVIENRCREMSSEMHLASNVISLHVTRKSITHVQCEVQSKINGEWSGSVSLPLPGSYQLENLATALVGLQHLQPVFPQLSFKAMQKGISEVTQLTGLMGRFQVLGHTPYFAVDGGHNPEGLSRVLETADEIPHERMHIVLGFSKGKDLSSMVELLPEHAQYYITQAEIPRAMPRAEIAQAVAKRQALEWATYDSVREALTTVFWNANEEDLVLATGSIFLVGEVIQWAEETRISLT